MQSFCIIREVKLLAGWGSWEGFLEVVLSARWKALLHQSCLFWGEGSGTLLRRCSLLVERC